MKIVVVAVRDQKADSFGNPWYAQTVPMALRHFADALQNTDDANIWRKHPEDFALFHLAYFDQQSGKFELLDSAVQLCVASDFRKE